jgi:type IV pilus assembly protein PilQ
VLLSLNNSNNSRAAVRPTATATRPYIRKSTPSSVAAGLMPEQGIRGIDFKRGDKGEGRILVSLANPDTVVNTKEEGGNVVLSFINTRLPDNLSKRLDVSEFATPVKTIGASSTSRETTISVGMQNSLYDYSLFQSEGLLTVEFRPLTSEEKELLDSKREKYKGDRLSLNFQDIDIRSVIAILAEFTGQSIVAGDEVTGSITLKLDDVPWDEALDFIMMTKGLEKFESGNVTMIAPVGKIKEYKEKQQATEQVVEQLEPLVTEYIRINYARAENFRNLLNGQDTGAFGACGASKASGGGSSGGSSSGGGSSAGSSSGGTSSSGQAGGNGTQNDQFRVLSSRGSAVVDARTNTLIVRETAKRLEDAKKLIRRLDVPVKQVMIEVRIAIASNIFAKQLGVRFGVGKQAAVGSKKVFAIGGAGTQGNSNAQVDDAGNIGTLSSQLVDLGLASPYGALGMTLARAADYVLNLELSALQDNNQGELLSNPRVLTSDRCQATIKQGTQIPYRVQQGQGAFSVEFKDATLTLDVTPQITPSGSVVMALKVSKDAPGAVTTDGVAIDTRQLETNVHVMDGETVVLGGIYEGAFADNVNKVPFFADLPGVGFLFKRSQKSDNKSELLIFVTPKIVKDNVAAN